MSNGSNVLLRAFCTDPIKNHCHLFFECSYTEEVWNGVDLLKIILSLQYTTHWDRIKEVLVVDSPPEKLRLFLLSYIFEAAIHFILLERNLRSMASLQVNLPTLSNTMIDTFRIDLFLFKSMEKLDIKEARSLVCFSINSELKPETKIFFIEHLKLIVIFISKYYNKEKSTPAHCYIHLYNRRENSILLVLVRFG